MHARIEIAEVVSFRLKVPLAELERLPSDRTGEVPITLTPEKGELVLESGDCSVRFRPVGRDAVLTELALCNDEGGLFFQRVVGPLFVRFEGDCELRLVWNRAERNTHGDFAAVTIRKGQTNYPGLSRPAQALRNALAVPGQPPAPAPAAPEIDPADLALLKEVELLLQRAKQEYAEYLRLKSSSAAAR